MERTELEQMPYVRLRKLAKRLNIKANMKATKLIDAIMKADLKLMDSPDLLDEENSQNQIKSNNCIENQENVEPTESNKNCKVNDSCNEAEETNLLNESSKNNVLMAKRHTRRGTFDKEEAEMGHLTPNIDKIETNLPNCKTPLESNKQKVLMNNKIPALNAEKNLKRANNDFKSTIPAASKIPQLITKPIASLGVRTPNFSRIHQRAFDKMDSIDDYMKKKSERLKKFSSCKKVLGTKTTSPKGFKAEPIPIKCQEFTIKHKAESRMEMHTKLFKKAASKNSKMEQKQFLKGVRTNKRFLLQMKARGIQPL